MVAAKALHKGMNVVVNSGPFRGLSATITDPQVFPDGHPEQRKVSVHIAGVGDSYIIPKQLSIASVAHAAPATPTVRTSTPITSLDDPALDRWRTRRASTLRKEYVSRKLPGGHIDTETLIKYWRDNRIDGYAPNIGLVGDTQSGKTMLVELMSVLLADQIGLDKPLPVFTLSGTSSITDHDMFGQYRPDENGDLVWMEGVVSLAARVGGILYLDEINAMPGNVTAALHPMCDERHTFVNVRKPVDDGHGGKMPEVVVCSTNLWIVATYNPGYAGMSRTNEAFAARFRWLPWDYDEETEKRLVKSPAVRLFGGALRNARDTRALVTPVGTSSLQRLEQDVDMFGIDYALWAFCGQFTSKAERTAVETIIEDRSIRVMLETEVSGVAPDEPKPQP